MSGIAYTNPLQDPALPLQEHVMWNRTGSTLNYGAVAAVDVTGSATEVKAYASFDSTTDKDDVSPLRNLITVGAAQDDGWLLVVVREPGGIADNASGRVATQGIVDVLVADSTTLGDRLSPATSTGTSLVAEADGTAICAKLLESNASGDIAARPCRFNGDCTFGPQAELA